LDDPARFAYFVVLTDIVGGVISDIFKATQAQKLEALVRCLGLWVECHARRTAEQTKERNKK